MQSLGLLECFLELLTPGQTSYGQIVRFKQPRNTLESNRIALKREVRYWLVHPRSTSRNDVRS